MAKSANSSSVESSPPGITVIGFLGTTLDKGRSPKRWQRWRPTVDLVRHESLPVRRIDLMCPSRGEALAHQIVDDIHSLSPDTEVVLHFQEINNPWDFEEMYETLYEFARSYSFEEDQKYLVHMTTGTHVAQICLFLLAESRHFPAELLQTIPPSKGEKNQTIGDYSLIDLNLSRYDNIAQRFANEAAEGVSYLKSGIVTQNAEFNAMMEELEQVVMASKAPILIMGPTGAGKSQLARRIYALKKQRRTVEGDLVEVNCATLRGDQAMSTLFGHRRGAFTGALADRPGLLVAANKGVLFLDEIGELGLDEQAMLLRALEEKSFLPVGADKEVKSDFQLLAGTNRDLRGDVREGKFRDDLLARIDLWTFELPGLAQRPEDIEPNLEFELERISTQLGVRARFSTEAQKQFLAFATSKEATWNRNFRDFAGALTRLATLAPGGRIDQATVKKEVQRLTRAWHPEAESPAASQDPVIAELEERLGPLDRFDAVQLAEVVKVCRQSRTLSEAGRQLFSASRQKKKTANDADRLRKYLARFELSFQDIR